MEWRKVLSYAKAGAMDRRDCAYAYKSEYPEAREIWDNEIKEAEKDLEEIIKIRNTLRDLEKLGILEK